MPRSHALSLLAFLLFMALALMALFTLPAALAMTGFIVMAVVGVIAANIVFNRTATPEEKRAELENRTRNGD